jgi:energy-coupling factor transporter ATP-binding protein EcfA2
VKLTRAYIENVGLVGKLEIPCNGDIVVVSGRNGSGKTTVLRAIQSVFQGGHQPDLIGPAGPQAVVELDFDNGWKFRREWSKKKYDLKGRSADGRKLTVTDLQAFVDSDFSLNPTGLIDAPAKERVEFLHRAMPLSFTRDEVAKACGEPASRFAETIKIDDLDRIREGRYDSRREKNVEWDRLKKTRETMVAALPDGDPLRFTWMDKAEGLDGQAVAVPDPVDPLVAVRDLETKLQQARKSLLDAVESWRSVFEETVAGINAEEQAELDAVRKRFEEQRNKAREAYERIAASERKPFDDYIERMAGELAAAQERAQQQARLEGVRDEIRKLDTDIVRVQDEAVRLDNAVKALDELKRQKLDKLPIEGVEVRGGQIFYEGKNFDTQLNTAKQYLLSTQVAALTRGEFPFMIVDNCEALVGDERREYIEGLAASGFQVVAAFAEEDKPLTIETVPVAEPVSS